MISENGLQVPKARYLRRNHHGQIVESAAQLFERVARAVSEAELLHGTAADARYWEERFHAMLSSLDFLPNSPTLMNARTPLLGVRCGGARSRSIDGSEASYRAIERDSRDLLVSVRRRSVPLFVFLETSGLRRRMLFETEGSKPERLAISEPG